MDLNKRYRSRVVAGLQEGTGQGVGEWRDGEDGVGREVPEERGGGRSAGAEDMVGEHHKPSVHKSTPLLKPIPESSLLKKRESL